MKKYEYLEHPADLKIRAFGETLPKLFINAACAVTNFLYEVVEEAQVTKTEKVQVEAANLEDLFINWLTEILYLSDANHLACVNFEIETFAEKKLVADVGMISATAKDDIKAITYSELSVKKTNDIWEAVFVCDI
ncbi:MAG: archease [Gammaproteobacteria bacterium]|jgi:SHS2 domain-containing protein